MNIYAKKMDVYLDGGPAKSGAAGLPPGEYYVQVTSPMGTLLGTSVGTGKDETPVVVDANGDFAECYQLWDIVCKASSLNKPNPQKGYDDTDNNGNEDKVWVSQSRDFALFLTKTDNFKVKGNGGGGGLPPQTSIEVLKFYDRDGDGVQDDGEPAIPMWHFDLLDAAGNVIGCQLTDADGTAEFLVDLDGATQYQVCEVFPTVTECPWVNTTDDCVDGTADASVVAIGFGNICIEETTGLGLTPGYWQSENSGNGGTADKLLAACDPRVARRADRSLSGLQQRRRLRRLQRSQL